MDVGLKIKFPEKYGSDDEVLSLDAERKRRKTAFIPPALIGRIQILDAEAQMFHFHAKKIQTDSMQPLFSRMIAERTVHQKEAAPTVQEITPPVSPESEPRQVEDFTLEILAEKVEKTALLMLETENVILELEQSLGIEMHEKIQVQRFSTTRGSGIESEDTTSLQNTQALEDCAEAIEGIRDLFDRRMKLITLRFNLQQAKQWEEIVFDGNEALQLLESALKIVEAQHRREKEKAGLVNFHLPETGMHATGDSTLGAVSCESMKKKNKPCNQDQYFHFSLPNLSFYLVCDGHGLEGEKVAAAICQSLPAIFGQAFEKMNEVTCSGVVNATRQAFRQLDQELTKFATSGSTLTCAIQTPIGLFFANVGDSRAVLDIEGKALQCTADQTTNEHTFVQFVKKRGTEIGYLKGENNGPLRVFPSMLMLTADLGNHQFQTEGIKHFTCIPEITFFPYERIKKGNSFLIIASDGLWNFANSNQVVSAFRERFEKGQSLQTIAKELAAACHHAGRGKFQDDTTIVIVRF